MSAPPPKLTKKQKKAVAFRERKQGKGKAGDGDEDHDIPVAEDQDMADAEVAVETDTPKAKPIKSKAEGKRKADDDSGAEKSKKRKRESDEKDPVEPAHETKKKKKSKGPTGAATPADASVAKQKKSKVENAQGKQKFILFVGNLKYTTSLELIKAHFAACDPPPSVRLLTPKPSRPNQPSTAKSKGCAFLEFTHRNALQQALKLHQSELDGRRINVELTAGGGGKSDNRTSKLRERNKGLDDQRKERNEKQAAEEGTSATILPERPQRYSATSGLEQSSAGKRTWTVGDVDDDGETHRGGRKHAKRGDGRKAPSRVWGTGVNAIPVG